MKRLLLIGLVLALASGWASASVAARRRARAARRARIARRVATNRPPSNLPNDGLALIRQARWSWRNPAAYRRQMTNLTARLYNWTRAQWADPWQLYGYPR